ncbi:MAG: hypothetical protein ABL871_16585 [Terricaulis sp.]
MPRAVLAALALAILPSCAYAQDGRIDRSETPIVRATANAIIQSLSESQYRDYGYRWDATSIRISRLIHWHIFEPDPRDRATDAIVRRNGWLDEAGGQVSASVFGDDEKVTSLSFEYSTFTNLDVLDALRDAGADVNFQADYETYSEYIIAAPGREPALLTTRRTCAPDNMASMQRCENGAEVTFELPD